MALTAAAILTGATCTPPATEASAPAAPPAAPEAPPAVVAAPWGATAPFTWYRTQGPGGWLTFGRAEVPGSPATVVHLHATGGMRHADEAFVTELSHRGIDVVLACWHQDAEEEIDCPNGPSFSGVSDAAVGDVDAIIAAVRRLPGLATRPIVITGLSRGGGIALLRAAEGRPEPVIAMNPLVVGSAWMRPDVDLDVDRRVNARMPKSLVMITDDDIFVPPAQQAIPFVAAARAVGAPVQLHHRPTGTHGGFIFDDTIRPWTADRVREFVYSVAARA